MPGCFVIEENAKFEIAVDYLIPSTPKACLCVCVCVCARARARVCVCVVITFKIYSQASLEAQW